MGSTKCHNFALIWVKVKVIITTTKLRVKNIHCGLATSSGPFMRANIFRSSEYNRASV